MTPPDAPTGPALRAPDRTLDPRVVPLWRNVIMLATAFAVLIPAVIAVLTLVAGAPAVVSVVAGAVACAAAVLGGALALVWPPRRFARFRWVVVDEGVVVRRGWLWQRLQIVPHSRIQAVDAKRGPLERRAGLATVHLRTASPDASPRIPGLAADEADALAEHIARHAGTDDAT